MNLLALYRGSTIEDIRLVTLTTDEEICATFAEVLLGYVSATEDEALMALDDGRKEALRRIVKEHDAKVGG